MEITQIIIRKRFENESLAAVVSVILDDVLAIHDIKVAYRPDGSFLLVMPKDGQGRDTVHPVKSEFRNYMQGIITKKINDARYKNVN